MKLEFVIPDMIHFLKSLPTFSRKLFFPDKVQTLLISVKLLLYLAFYSSLDSAKMCRLPEMLETDCCSAGVCPHSLGVSTKLSSALSTQERSLQGN